MLFIMLVGLFTSRVVLQTLGISDYGIYSVVGGVIGMLGYFNIVLSGGTSRFLTFALGKGNDALLRDTFETSLSLACFAGILVFILGETIGLWFVYSKLNIPLGRETAALWVYQCALFSSILVIIQNPFTASIISHEKMSVYSYLSIFESISKLGIVYILFVVSVDKLKAYSVLLAIVAIFNLIVYAVYCRKTFVECRIRAKVNKSILKEMFNYSGWNMLGSISSILNNYGVNILLNLFFGTIVNAARGIANQVSGIVQQFCGNFQMAARPQITKYYANDEKDLMIDLIMLNAKYSAFLVLLLIIPLGANIDGILDIWLVEVPEYSSSFILLVFLQILFYAIDGPIGIGIQSVGKMKLPNLLSGIVYVAIFPITYIVLNWGGSPITSYIVSIATTPIIFTLDFWILKKYTAIKLSTFINKVVLKVVLVAVLTLVIPVILYLTISGGKVTTIILFLIDLVYVASIIFLLGIPKEIQKKAFHIIIERFK